MKIKMKWLAVLYIFLVPFLASAQTNSTNEVQFIKNVSWNKIVQKAKAENKFIFVDCYASWCGPCKMMDKDVYANDTVGSYMNSRFISVKYQLDTSRKDDAEIRAQYADAHHIAIQYHIGLYPTFLFFSPDGEPVHKGAGYLKPANFIHLAKDAMDPDKQFYLLLNRYKEGHLPFEKMTVLTAMAQAIDDKNLAIQIGKDYMHQYLDKLPENQFLTKNNLDFIRSYLLSVVNSSDRLFKLAKSDPGKVDDPQITFKGFSHGLINAIVYREEFAPQIELGLKNGHEPKWDGLANVVKRKFGDEYIASNTLKAKVKYYHDAQKWPMYTHFFVEWLEGMENAAVIPGNEMILNNDAWEVFTYSNNKDELAKALLWIDRALSMFKEHTQRYASVLDTKANILYKMGRKEEALALEQEAIKLDPKDGVKANTLEKFKTNQPTWGLAQ